MYNGGWFLLNKLNDFARIYYRYCPTQTEFGNDKLPCFMSRGIPVQSRFGLELLSVVGFVKSKKFRRVEIRSNAVDAEAGMMIIYQTHYGLNGPSGTQKHSE